MRARHSAAVVVTGLVLLLSLLLPAWGHCRSITTDTFEFLFSDAVADEVQPLIEGAEPMGNKVLRTLGHQASGRVRVRVARNVKVFQESMPEGYQAPRWAIGVAFPRLRLMVLRLGEHDLEKTFIHEFSHIALHESVGHRPLPRWFDEGFAIYQADEYSLRRATILMRASLGGSLIPLVELEQRFPKNVSQVNLAYAQSAHFVVFLLDEFGADRFRAFVRSLQQGNPFYHSLISVYGMSLDELERKWHSQLRLTFSWLPVLTGSTVLWFLITALFILGYVKRRRAMRARLAQWEAEETDLH